MRLLLDLQAAQSHGDSGVGGYVTRCARALMATGQVERLLLDPRLRFPPELPTDLLTSPLLIWSTANAVDSVGDDAAYLILAPTDRAWPTSVLPSHVSRRGWPVVVLLHAGATDLDQPRGDLIRQADLVLAASEEARRDAVDHLGLATEVVVIVGTGAVGTGAVGEVTWTTVAHRIVEAVRSLGAVPVGPRPRRPARPLIGVVGPLPPVDSGIATYNGRLLDQLSKLAEVLVFDPMGTASSRDVAYEVASLPLLETMYNPWSFDHLVYTLGNSVHHVGSIAALRRHPGVAWLHDVRLTGPAWAASLRDPDPDRFMADQLAQLYPGAELLTTPHLRALPGELAGRGLGMTGRVVADSTGVIVSSHMAARLLALDQRPGATLPPVEVIPHPVPNPPLARLPELDPPLLVALGIVAAVKSPLILVEALALVRRSHPAQLAFVGWIGEDWRQAITESAAALGIGDWVTITGEVPDDQYWRWAAKATVGVQLRSTSYGESSGAVADLLALGVPCVTDVAAAGELPEGTVHRLPHGSSSEELAAAIVGLLEEPRRRAALSRGCRAEASRRTFAAAAADLLGALERLRAARR